MWNASQDNFLVAGAFIRIWVQNIISGVSGWDARIKWQFWVPFIAGPMQKMQPINNLQVAVKNNIDVFYFSCLIPAHVLFVEGGKMGIAL